MTYNGKLVNINSDGMREVVDDASRLRAALALELALLRESLHVLHCADRAAPCPTRERELAAIKRLEEVLKDDG